MILTGSANDLLGINSPSPQYGGGSTLKQTQMNQWSFVFGANVLYEPSGHLECPQSCGSLPLALHIGYKAQCL